MKIGEILRRLRNEANINITPDTIRYYEKVGLISPKRDTTSRHRIYDDFDHLKRVFILAEIGVPLHSLKDEFEIGKRIVQIKALVKLLEAKDD